jgi:hypothetical protein
VGPNQVQTDLLLEHIKRLLLTKLVLKSLIGHIGHRLRIHVADYIVETDVVSTFIMRILQERWESNREGGLVSNSNSPSAEWMP